MGGMCALPILVVGGLLVYALSLAIAMTSLGSFSLKLLNVFNSQRLNFDIN